MNMKKYLWSLIILGVVFPSLATWSYAAKIMGVPWWLSFAMGVWTMLSILSISEKLSKLP